MNSIRSSYSDLIDVFESSERYLPQLLAIGGGCLMLFPVFLCMAVILVAMAVGATPSEGEVIDIREQISQVDEEVSKYEDNNSKGSIEVFTLSCEGKDTGNLTYEETEYWSFEGQAGDLVTVSLMTVSENLQPRLLLKTQFGKDRAYGKFTATDNGNEVLIDNYLIRNNNLYILEISAISGQGEYEIALSCRPPTTPTETSTATPTAEPSLPTGPTPIPGLETGDIQITLIWSSTADLDLHVVDPSGEEISYENPHSASGGKLANEGNGSCALATTSPIENIFWATGTAPPGVYTIVVHYFGTCREEGDQMFEVIVRVDGQLLEIVRGSISAFEGIQVYQFSH